MNRRTTLKGLAAGSIGLLAFGYWAKEAGIFTDDLPATLFSTSEQTTLSAITDTIIPKGDAIGALDVGTDKFLEKLLEKCYETDVQEKVKNQLFTLESSANNLYSTSFSNCTQTERESLLITLSTSKNEEEKEFFDLMKSQTIRGFRTSKSVMLDYLKHEIAPGRYNGCVDVNS
ncbi:gluconate 2-dehydrogenase subunit 3 family protein [Urechidicola croceus]|uniref:Twin-arginine translocation pathway signal protein n=1 Tax=Urechidicola croceus TaxID=1850246 RepID=A0A1D8P7B3_9FLAO|nr:gluconate 2-dehydrogenase subunit 3 family protein [Urechidicola croceus]AOW20465.1 hypothetical protein LPB138_07160 [Urechidicola croceus]